MSAHQPINRQNSDFLFCKKCGSMREPSVAFYRYAHIVLGRRDLTCVFVVSDDCDEAQEQIKIRPKLMWMDE